MQNFPGLMGGLIFFLIWLIMMAVMLGGYIVLIVALWRGMKAHESIADSLKNYLNPQQAKVPDTIQPADTIT